MSLTDFEFTYEHNGKMEIVKVPATSWEDAKERARSISKSFMASNGRRGGNKTAERGPEYFKQIAAMRKTRAGGRPRKNG